MSITFDRIRDTFQDEEYRQIYSEEFSNSKIATQIKVLREQRGWTQQQLAEASGMKQSRIATLEDVNYSSWSIRTLRRLAEAFDLWLDVEFKEFGSVWSQLRDFSRESLARHSFEDDPVFKRDNTRWGTVSTTTSPMQEQLPLVGSALSGLILTETSGQQSFANRRQPSLTVGFYKLGTKKSSTEPSSAAQMLRGEDYEGQNHTTATVALAATT